MPDMDAIARMALEIYLATRAGQAANDAERRALAGMRFDAIASPEVYREVHAILMRARRH